VQPAARAGPSFRASIDDGKFHGVIAPITPTAWYVVNSFVVPVGAGIISPFNLRISSANHLM